MRIKKSSAIGAIGLTATLLLSACAGTSSAGTSGSKADGTVVPTAKAEGKTITVWAMQGGYGTPTLDAINSEFTKLTGATVKVQIEQWDGITTKVSTALATSTPPDVLDLGNTQVAGFAANGGLLDLTPYQKDLQHGQTWLTGLQQPATVDGKMYGVPGMAGNRAVVYNKKIWSAAGVTTAPKTYEELTADLDKIKAANTQPNFSAFYYPGGAWSGATQFVWDAGGSIASKSGSTWKGGFSSAAAQEGLNEFKKFQNNYSSVASRTTDGKTPDETQILADGATSAIIGTSSTIRTALGDNPNLAKDDLGVFPFPGTSGKNQPVMLGGSVWGVAQKSQNKDLAVLWAKIAGSPSIQSNYVFAKDGWIPNSSEGIKAAQASGLSPQTAGFFEAALRSESTPAAPGWQTIENDNSIVQFYEAIASGSKSPAAAAKDFDAHIDSVLNGQ